MYKMKEEKVIFSVKQCLETKAKDDEAKGDEVMDVAKRL